jgi:hypothetical protein
MAAFEQSRTAPFGAITVHNIVSVCDIAYRAIRAKIAAERTHDQLSRLSAAQLRDIGLADQDLGSFCRDLSRRGL